MKFKHELELIEVNNLVSDIKKTILIFKNGFFYALLRYWFLDLDFCKI